MILSFILTIYYVIVFLKFDRFNDSSLFSLIFTISTDVWELWPSLSQDFPDELEGFDFTNDLFSENVVIVEHIISLLYK